MKKILIVALLSFFTLCLVLPSCLKSNSTPTCSDKDPSEEYSTMQAYCFANSINYIADTTGLFYQILDPGTDPKPTFNSIISVTYIGKMLDGSTIDSTGSTPVRLPLNQFIAAWQIGLQKIGKGGHIKMIAPSALCYGCYGKAPIVPPNTILYFDVTLVDVQ
jgi:FKBP-type peptidyl-prolyl cis-trans isomerase FkpA